MKENKTNWWVIVAVAVVVAIVASLVTIGLTGNVIKQNNNIYGKYQLYTKPEIDAKGFTTRQGVLNILNSCNGTLTEGSNRTCNQICGESKKICAVEQLLISFGSGEQISPIVSCNFLPDDFELDGVPEDIETNCLCCI